MRSHKHLFAWQKARKLVLLTHQFLARHWSPPSTAVFDQCRRAALSSQLNLAEGIASGPGPRCKYHYRIAYASAVEATDLLELCRDLRLGPDQELDSLVSLSREVQALTMLLLKATR